MIPTQADNPNGLHQRYRIAKTNGEEVDQRAEYFVMRLDEYGHDKRHVNACRYAVLQYALRIKSHLPELANDLIARYNKVLPEDDALAERGGI